jgi:lipopolysaccharide transport system permease protein
MRSHENYKELVWALAKTDFKLRYQNSVLGYLWAILNPLLMFSILNFIFSNIFARGAGIKYYGLQLLVSIILFNFFSEGTKAGMSSLISKSSLVTKIYVPRWTIVLASTVNSALIFLMNLIVIALFFIYKGFYPSFAAFIFFVIFIILTYIIILALSYLTAPLYVKFRDLLMIWTVLLTIMFYASPIVYPLQRLPDYVQRIILINPIAFVIHFSKEALINNHFPDDVQIVIFIFFCDIFLIIGHTVFSKMSSRIAEDI